MWELCGTRQWDQSDGINGINSMESIKDEPSNFDVLIVSGCYFCYHALQLLAINLVSILPEPQYDSHAICPICEMENVQYVTDIIKFLRM